MCCNLLQCAAMCCNINPQVSGTIKQGLAVYIFQEVGMNWQGFTGRKSLSSLGVWLGLFCLCLVLVISCARKPANEINNAGNGGDRITIGTTLKVRTIDPADAYDIASLWLITNMGDRLYTYKPGTTQLEPQLATALPKIDKDGLTYTIPLRQGVRFHDGTPFNAEAMVFSLRRFMDNKGQPAFLIGDLVDSIKTTGEYELTIKLKKPFAAFTSLLTFAGLCAVSPQAYQNLPDKFLADKFIGTGPYKLDKYSNEAVKLQVFDEYWGEKPINKGIDIQRFSSSANLYNSFRSQNIDVAYQSLDQDQIRSLLSEASSKGYQNISAKGNSVTYMIVNLKQPPLDNILVRKAIATIINRALINDRVFYGQAEPTYSMIPNTFNAYKPVFQELYGDANIDKAKAFLTQAGYSKDKPVKIELWYPSSSNVRSLSAIIIKAITEKYLEGIIQFDIKGVEATTAYGYIDKGVYPTFILDWYADFFDADNYMQPFLECTKGSPQTGCTEGASQNQGSFYYNEQANKLIAQQRQEQNPELRKAIFTQLQQILAQDVPYIPLWQSKDYIFSQQNIQGVTIEPTQLFSLSPISKK